MLKICKVNLLGCGIILWRIFEV